MEIQNQSTNSNVTERREISNDYVYIITCNNQDIELLNIDDILTYDKESISLIVKKHLNTSLPSIIIFVEGILFDIYDYNTIYENYGDNNKLWLINDDDIKLYNLFYQSIQ
jgi:hypothetical protein